MVFINKILQKKIRSCVLYGLIFFLFTALFACNQREENNEITVQWEDKKAIGISIPKKWLEKISPDSITQLLQIRLLTSGNFIPILGNYLIEDKVVTFSPLVPFTHKLNYEVRIRNQRIGSFNIPPADPADAPALLAIFPSQDTLPENLLKIYLHFSQPMQEGKSDQYVILVKNNTDTIRNAFLNLQPELWNEDRTILTLWLDPGRIKRDLQPNKLLGAPLQKNENYRVIVSAKWQNLQGLNLRKEYIKKFVTTGRDSLSPKPHSWKINVPQSGTKNLLKVDFGESLDYSLIKETLTIWKINAGELTGKWEIDDEERKIYFVPNEEWEAGNYIIRVETRLEDLAGNNINRPFDRDIARKEDPVNTGDFVDIPFKVED